MLLIAVVAAGLGWMVRSAREQRQAVEAIRARGGFVEYDYRYNSTLNQRLPKGESWQPGWLRRLLGDDYFHNIIVVGLDENHDATDADLSQVARLRHLKRLYLGGGKITDDGLAQLQGLTDLRLLVLWGNPITGDGLKHLRHLQNLKHLDLSRTRVTDSRLADLGNLTGLERLDIPVNPQLNGSFLEYIKDLPSLKSLVLRNSGVNDAALSHLAQCKSLQDLMLDGTKVTEVGVSRLRRLSNLRSLDLTYQLSNDGLERVRAWFPRATVTPLNLATLQNSP